MNDESATSAEADAAAPVDADAPPVRHADLAAEVSPSDWRHEGGAAVPAGEYDSTEDDKIRRAALTTLVGGGIGIVGLVGVGAGMGMAYGAQPKTRLAELENGDGALPAGDSKRRSLIRTARATPFVLGGGIALVTVGTVVAIVGSRRLKRLRNAKRERLTFGVAPERHAFTAHLSLRF